jgi:pyruvate dehydrogenase phosphatase
VTCAASDDWEIEHLTTIQNGDNDKEVERVQREHPGESECVQDGRILGALAPFACIVLNLFSLHSKLR